MKKLATILLTAGLLASSAVAVSAAYELTPYDVPSNGVHFSFDGTYSTDNGELTGTPKGSVEFIEGRDGTAKGAVYFGEAEDYVELLKEDYYGNWTVSAWVRTDEVVSWAFLLHSMEGSVRPVTNDNILGESGVSHHSTFSDYMFSSALPLGEWAMMTVTNDLENGVISLYIDGEFMENTEKSMPLPLTIIGGDSPDLHGWQVDQYMGVDDLWIYGRVLSAEDIAILYETGVAPQVEEGAGKMSEEAIAAEKAAQLEAERNPFGLEKYEIPAEGIHFAFDGSYSTDNGELAGEAQGTIVSVADRNGTADSAVCFDTADDFVLLNKADYWGDWSASAWIKFNDQFPNYSFLLQSATHFSLRPAFNGGEGKIGIGAHTGDANIDTALTINEWQMLTYTYSAELKLVTIYLNGAAVGTIEKELPLALSFIGSDAPAEMNGMGWAIDPYMSVDDLWLFGKTLTEAEVAALYNNNSVAAETAAPEAAEEVTAVEPEVVETEVVETVEPEVEEAVTEAPEAETVETAAPQTSDAFVFAVLAFVTALGMAVTLRKVNA